MPLNQNISQNILQDYTTLEGLRQIIEGWYKLREFWRLDEEEQEEILRNLENSYISEAIKSGEAKRFLEKFQDYFSVEENRQYVKETNIREYLPRPNDGVEERFEKLATLYTLLLSKSAVVFEEMQNTKPVKQEPKFPVNGLFMTFQKWAEKEVDFGGGKRKARITFTDFRPKNAFEKALFLSIQYAFAYYTTQGIYQIKLTDLMGNIGFSKWLVYEVEKKKEVLDMVWRVIANSKFFIQIGEEVPISIKMLFPRAKKGGYIAFPVWVLKIIEEYTPQGQFNDAIIRFEPTFDPRGLYIDKSNKVLSLNMADPEYKIFAIYVSYGKAMKNKQITVKVQDLLKHLGISIDEINPKRTYKRLGNIFRRAEKEGLICGYSYEATPQLGNTGGWLQNWLETLVTIKLYK